MRGKAQRDSPVLVLSAPPGEYDRMITKLVYLRRLSDSSRLEKTVPTTVRSKIQQLKKSAEVVISNSVHVPIADVE